MQYAETQTKSKLKKIFIDLRFLYFSFWKKEKKNKICIIKFTKNKDAE